jgi:hypothetical protein
MTAFPGQTQTTLGQLCAALWHSQSQPYVIQPGIEPGSVVTPLALLCSALELCATRSSLRYVVVYYILVDCKPLWIRASSKLLKWNKHAAIMAI